MRVIRSSASLWTRTLAPRTGPRSGHGMGRSTTTIRMGVRMKENTMLTFSDSSLHQVDWSWTFPSSTSLRSPRAWITPC